MYKNYSDMPEIVIRISDGASIPKNELNKDYQEYLHWLEEGNEPEIIENP